MRSLKRTRYHSLIVGPLPQGCQQCLKGAKMVFYATGICGAGCSYCPLSAGRKADRMFANERPVTLPEEIVDECKLMDAQGCGITGGDPLVSLKRTCDTIRLLKQTFGSGFHIHLYTPLRLVDERRLAALYEAGLDEIRFHPFLEQGRDKDWVKIKLGKANGRMWKVGLEIPLFPDKIEATKKLILFAEPFIDFINFNELEFSEENMQQLLQRGYRARRGGSYAAQGSEEAAEVLLTFVRDCTSLSGYFCPVHVKDHVQLGNRLKRRAKHVALPSDSITDEGLLYRGAIYAQLPSFASLFSFTESQRGALLDAMHILEREYNIPANLLHLDPARGRILTSVDVVCKYKTVLRHLNLAPACILEYPTHDATLVELDAL